MEAGKAAEFQIDADGVLRYKGRLCVPEQEILKGELLKEAHNSSYSIHPGGNMTKEIAEYVSKCYTCQLVNIEHKRPASELKPLPVP